MKIRRDLIVVALATFCLTATVFMTRPTLSNSGTTSKQAVNQWTDINDDGTVDIFDAILLSNDFGATTDPIKNVNVTNWPTPKSEFEIQHWVINISEGQSFGLAELGFSGGFSRLSLGIWPGEYGSLGECNFTVWLYALDWEIGYATTRENPSFYLSYYSVSGVGTGFDTPKSLITEVKGPYFRLWFSANSTQPGTWSQFDIFAYLRNE